MKRGGVWSILAFLVSLPVLLAHSTNNTLLWDTDTSVLLRTLRERNAPLSWFTGDWPLGNHFYRPLPTLTFELDQRLYGTNPLGYGWTNAILCALCVLALYWFLVEISTSRPWALAGAGLFTLWTLDLGRYLTGPLLWACVPLILVGMYRHSFRVRSYIPACLVLYFFGLELAAPEMTSPSLSYSMIGWLPGRTASVMTLFALIATAAYARYERSRNVYLPPLPSKATDPPASTRSGKLAIPKGKALWLAVSALASTAAFASYEQAVMLPAILFGVAVYFRLQRRKPDWKVHLLFWGLLVGYLVLRHYILPTDVSRYQAQQFRGGGPGAWIALADYFLPTVSILPSLWVGLSVSLLVLLTNTVMSGIVAVVSAVTTAVEARRNWRPILAGWALSGLAFLPLAFIKPFGHYHYWPLALRAIFVLGLAKLTWDLVSIAVCPPVLKAPPRPSPAPGSLPHR
jgi:hypothetical protein